MLIISIIVWAISAVGLVVLVLLHSGKGAGLSETFGGMQSAIGTGLIEKNLDRITIVCAAVFVVSLISMMLIWPTA